MRLNRGVLTLWLGLALSAGVSCTAGEGPLGTEGGDTPEVEQPVPPGDGGSVTPSDSGTGTPADTGTVTPGDTASVPPADSGSVSPADSVGPPATVSLLMCQPQAYAVTTAVIGPQGGTISVGNHRLTIYENALSADVTITAEQIEGTVSSVRFSPEGLQLAVPAELTLSYQHCAPVPGSKRVADTDDSLKILGSPVSVDISGSSEVTGEIDQLSRYAVAY